MSFHICLPHTPVFVFPNTCGSKNDFWYVCMYMKYKKKFKSLGKRIFKFFSKQWKIFYSKKSGKKSFLLLFFDSCDFNSINIVINMFETKIASTGIDKNSN